MGIKISEFGIEVPGKVVRTTDGDTTTLTLTAEQARVVHEATGLVLAFVDQQQELPLEPTVAATNSEGSLAATMSAKPVKAAK